MIKDKDIIVFSDDWGRFPSTVQHIIKYFLPTNRVYWIGSLGLRKPKLRINDFKRVYQKLFSFFNYKETNFLPQNLSYFSFFVIPFHDLKFVRSINLYLLTKQINKILLSVHLDNLIVFTSNPIVSDIINRINPKCSVYFCLDDYTKFNDAFDYIRIGEMELLNHVNLTYCVSKPLLESRLPKNGRSFHLSQGIHLNHFIKKSTHESTNNKADKSRPIVGFFGLIAEWVNTELIINCANNYPNYDFLIIGPHTVDISQFYKVKNIDYLGEKSFNELPNLAKDFDIGIIPFRINELTLAVNPLKLIEYFSMGIPVVSMNIPEVANFGDLVYLSDTDEDFVKNIKIAVEDKSIPKLNNRIEVANSYSWEKISNDISTQINNILSN